MARAVLPSVANRLPTEIEELDRVARVLEDLETHPGWSVLVDLVDQEVADLDARLDGGSKPLEQAEYALLHGKRGALTFPRDVLATVREKYRDRVAELERQPEAAKTGR